MCGNLAIWDAAASRIVLEECKRFKSVDRIKRILSTLEQTKSPVIVTACIECTATSNIPTVRSIVADVLMDTSLVNEKYYDKEDKIVDKVINYFMKLLYGGQQ